MKVGAGAILGVIISGIVLGAGSAIFENSKANVLNTARIDAIGKQLDEHERRIMQRFDKLESKLDGNRINR